MNRLTPWFVGITPSTSDADYFAAAPAGFELRIRPTHEGDPTLLTGTWCPEGMQLATLVTRNGHRAVFWIDARVNFGEIWTDGDIRELLFEEPHNWNALRRRPRFSASRTPKPCPAV